MWALLMAEQAQLLLLKSKLSKIRRDKKNYKILAVVIVIAINIIVWGIWGWKSTSLQNSRLLSF
jgi:hypothetical protein